MLSRLALGAVAVLIVVAAIDAVRQSVEAPPAAPEPAPGTLLEPAFRSIVVERQPPHCSQPPRRDRDASVVLVGCDHWAAYRSGQVVVTRDVAPARP